MSHALSRRLLDQLTDIRIDTSPFAAPLPREYSHHARWVQPILVADVDYRGWTGGKFLRHPSFKGLRPDRDPDGLQGPQ